jgi:hypothetical protein
MYVEFCLRAVGALSVCESTASNSWFLPDACCSESISLEPIVGSGVVIRRMMSGVIKSSIVDLSMEGTVDCTTIDLNGKCDGQRKSTYLRQEPVLICAPHPTLPT